MYYQFNTDSLERAKAALILYAIYKSRNPSSSLNGLETWNRFTSYVRGACLKSANTAEFVNHLCKMAETGSIKPVYLKDKSNEGDSSLCRVYERGMRLLEASYTEFWRKPLRSCREETKYSLP